MKIVPFSFLVHMFHWPARTVQFRESSRITVGYIYKSILKPSKRVAKKMATCLLGYNEQKKIKRLGRQKFSYWGSRNGAAYIRCRRCTNNSPHMRPRSYTRENGERNIPDQGVSGEPQSSRWRSSCTRAASSSLWQNITRLGPGSSLQLQAALWAGYTALTAWRSPSLSLSSKTGMSDARRRGTTRAPAACTKRSS